MNQAGLCIEIDVCHCLQRFKHEVDYQEKTYWGNIHLSELSFQQEKVNFCHSSFTGLSDSESVFV